MDLKEIEAGFEKRGFFFHSLEILEVVPASETNFSVNHRNIMEHMYNNYR